MFLQAAIHECVTTSNESECALCPLELRLLPPLLFSVDLLLFKVFFQVKTNKKKSKATRRVFVFFFDYFSRFPLSLADFSVRVLSHRLFLLFPGFISSFTALLLSFCYFVLWSTLNYIHIEEFFFFLFYLSC